VNLAEFRKCLAEYTVHNLVIVFGLATPLLLLNSIARCCNKTKFFTKMVLFYMLVCRKNFVPLHRKVGVI